LQVRWHGTGLVRVGCWYPSAKTCSACGTVKSALLLSERTGCYHTRGFDCDRDLNPVRNIEVFTV
jgi:putative transposase